MLQVASRTFDDDLSASASNRATGYSRPAARSKPQLRAQPAERYGAQSRPNLFVIAAILFTHAVLLGLFMQVRQKVERREEAKLTVVNLSPPPPPPPSSEPDAKLPARSPVVAPPPIVQAPVAVAPQVQTAPSPSPVIAPVPVAAPPSPAPAAAPAQPAVVQSGDLGTQMIAGKPPRYPVDSRRKREQGTVELSLVLGVDGAVESIDIAQSSGFPRLDNAARDAVKGWRWKPTIRGGQPVRVRGVVEIPFVLRSGTA